jgi:archaemetzincin
MAGKELQLVSVASVSAAVISEFSTPIAQVLGVSSFLGKAALAKPGFAFNKDRRQYHSTSIMRRLLTLKEPGVPHLMGVCDVDLFVPDTSFVYGEADRESHVALMSLQRLKGDTEAHRRRVFVEVVHQAGHLVGLSFCEDPRCTMFQATTITDAERRQLGLCSNCRNELTRLRRV